MQSVYDNPAGWSPQLRDRKIKQLASVIGAIDKGWARICSVCVVENRFVVDRLVEKVNATLASRRSCAVVHVDTDDARGVDVAFIYDDTLLQVPLPPEDSAFFHVVIRRHATREILQVNFKTRADLLAEHDGRQRELLRTFNQRSSELVGPVQVA